MAGSITAVMQQGHVHILRDGHQVAVYRCTREGDFYGWGWVETRNGRADYNRWADFTRALGVSGIKVKEAVEA